jgi:hypothetical protein
VSPGGCSTACWLGRVVGRVVAGSPLLLAWPQPVGQAARLCTRMPFLRRPPLEVMDAVIAAIAQQVRPLVWYSLSRVRRCH